LSTEAGVVAAAGAPGAAAAGLPTDAGGGAGRLMQPALPTIVASRKIR
jgi:hypothetical protein